MRPLHGAHVAGGPARRPPRVRAEPDRPGARARRRRASSSGRRRSGAGGPAGAAASSTSTRSARGRAPPASRPFAAAIGRTRRHSSGSTAPPAVLHVAGGLERLLELVAADPVAIVGSRRASPYGLDVARSLGRGLAFSGITIVSGMALGIDSAAHAGALDAGRPTVAVLPASADRPYPAGKRLLHRRIVATGAAVSELGPGPGVRRWMFPARNRIIAALAAMTVVVEAGERSGALLTAGLARRLDLPVGAVPGRVTTPQAAGPNALLAGGAGVVRGPQDVLDHLFGAGARAAGRSPAARRRPSCDRCSRRSPRVTRPRRRSRGPGCPRPGAGGACRARARGVRAARRRRPVHRRS